MRLGRRELVVADRWVASSTSHWYGGVTETDVPTLVQQHLIGGEPGRDALYRPRRFLRLKSARNFPEGSMSNTAGAYSR
jgi:(2Fe-2S) ferredoxin